MNKFYWSLISLFIFSSCASTSNAQLFEFSKEQNHMGTVFQITAIHSDESIAKKAIEEAYKEVVRIENLISSWDENSETSTINKNAGNSKVAVGVELFQLIARSKKISELTNGVFDISFASIDKIWHFDGTMMELPDSNLVNQSIEKINFQNIILEDSTNTVFLKRSGMKIGFGGIGKGYAANMCKQIMIELGIENGVVNAGGDLICWGNQKTGSPWTIGIADPSKIDNALSYLEIKNKAVVTSGNYERFVEFNGNKYCHIINPKTGWPVENLQSVTILCPDAEIADALATSVFILGTEDGLALINQLKNIECFIVDENNQLFTSKGIELEYLKE